MFIVEIKFHIWNVIPYQNTQCDIYLIILRLPILCFYEFELMANYITRGKKILSRHPSWKTLYKMEGYTRCPFRAGRFYIITTDTHTYSLCLFSRISSIFTPIFIYFSFSDVHYNKDADQIASKHFSIIVSCTSYNRFHLRCMLSPRYRYTLIVSTLKSIFK